MPRLVTALPIVVLAVSAWAPPVQAQSERTIEIIESALAARADERNGAALYRDLCASCHGRRGHGKPADVTPALAGQLTIYLIKQLADFSEGDRVSAEMHRVAALKQISRPQAIRDVSTYLSSLPPNDHPEVGDGSDLDTGKRFYDGLCAYCHGRQGEGSEQHATPALQRQHYSYLLMQSRQISIGHRYSVPFEVQEILESIPLEILTAIADYASRLPQSSAEPAVVHKDMQRERKSGET